jgi:hypothetical protein
LKIARYLFMVLFLGYEKIRGRALWLPAPVASS